MVLTLGPGTGNQRVLVDALRSSQHCPGDVDRIIERQFARYPRGCISQVSDAFAEGCARGMVDLVDQPAHNVVEKRSLLAAKIRRSGSKQIRNAPQNLG